jgi:type II secretory pathway component PulM
MNARLEQQLDRLKDYLDRLSQRERFLVIFTSIFLIVVAVGSALWFMHQAAATQEKRLNQLKDTTIWMQSHAARMKPATEMQLSAAERIQRAAQQTGLAISSQQQGEKIQILAAHQNYVILANFMTQLAQLGLSIEKMELTNEGAEIKLTAIVL